MKIISDAVWVLSMALGAQAQTQNLMSKEMEFDKCVATTKRTVGSLGQPYTVIVNTKILYMVKIKVEDGDMLITCSKPDKKMTTTLTKGE